MPKELTEEQVLQILVDPEHETGIADANSIELLVSTVKANRELLKEAHSEIRESRRTIVARTAWKDFLKRYFNK